MKRRKPACYFCDNPPSGSAHNCVHCRECWEASYTAKQRAIKAVAGAVKLGALPALDGSVLCVDCGNQAQHYDHRDYGKKLDVEPTCRSCNSKRGPADFPGTKYRLADLPARLAELEGRMSA